MQTFSRKIFNVFFILLLLGGGYYYRDNIIQFVESQLANFRPCSTPISYSIGTFDKRFGITEKEFLNTIAQAEKIWESSANKPLFQYKKDGKLKINLVYDVRQQSTDKLKKLGIVIGEDRNAYDTLKAQHNSLSVSFEADKKTLEATIAAYQSRKTAYEKEVEYSNSRGGVSKEKYQELEQERIILNSQVEIINQAQNTLNDKADTVNAMGAELNKLARNLNLQVKTFNTIGGAGEEFDEGEYVKSGTSTTINIYQFDNQNKLLRVLAHELGHALGLEHVDDPKAIMYRTNQNTNEKLTSADILALKKLCGIK